MKIRNWLLPGIMLLAPILPHSPATALAAVTCGETITEDTTLTADLTCPSGTGIALSIDASNITLDLGGHTISGDPFETGVLVNVQDGITIKNGTINNFNDGIFLIDSDNAIIEQLIIHNLTVSDTTHFIFGVHLDNSHNAIVRNMQFEFLPVAHKEAVEVYASDVAVDNITVQGGGSGVGFSFAGTCDPVNGPSNGSVLNSHFSDIAIAGIWVACTSNLLIENNVFSTTTTGYGLLGIQADPPNAGAVTGMIIRNNAFNKLDYGIEFRGIQGSSIINNRITHNQYWGIFMRHSLGCFDPVNNPGWDCFNSTGNTITDNFVLGNGGDLYHDEFASGNIWTRNFCRVKQGAEIPDCIPPFILSLPIISR